MTIQKEKFFEILDYLQENDKFENELRKLLFSTSKNTEFIDAALFTDCTLIDYLIYLLEDTFEDHQTGWISYWIYDLNYGKAWQPGTVTQFNQDIKLETKEDLYNFLIYNMMDDYIGSTD